MDGIIIWTNKPSKHILNTVKLGVIKFLCAWKKRFGLNMQGICDDRRSLLDVDIFHPASTSCYLAFDTSPISDIL